jgi:cation transport regulator ChaC
MSAQNPRVPPATTWYFAYGSNLDPRTFVGRRRMRPFQSRVGRLPDYRLVFDLPVGRGERGVANVRRRPGEHVWGVLYEIGQREAARLDRTEGVHRGYYRRIPVAVELAHGAHCDAYTLASDRGRAGRKPSRRYLGLLWAGSRHHGLPDEWVDHLRSLELAADERNAQRELFGAR